VHPNLAAFHGGGKAPPASPWPRRLAAGALGLLVVALAQPQWLGPWIQRVPTGRDLVLLVDTSATMSIRDFQWQGRAVQRISVLKALVNRFVTARPADRFGVIAFGSVAGTLVPPTFDRDLLTGMIRRLQVGIAGQNTALGDAIALGLKQLHGQAQLRPAFILFSDGGDSNAGQMTTREAVELARKDGVAVYTVAISSRPDTAVPAAAADTAGDAQPNLRQIAQLTGGRYYRAGTTGALRNVIDAIGEREKTVPRAPTRRAVQQWYLLPLLLAVLLFCVARLMGAGGVDP
ncbi:MAG: VWA domain-containing protein, partial [Gammaproteobacteria bacterium]